MQVFGELEEVVVPPLTTEGSQRGRELLGEEAAGRGLQREGTGFLGFTSDVLRRTDTESEEEEAIPPLITAEIPDHLHFVLDEEFQLDCKAEGTEPIT